MDLIKKAINDLKSRKSLNIRSIAFKNSIYYKTLRKRFKKITLLQAKYYKIK